MKSPFRLLDMGFSIPISTSRTMSILIVSRWNGGIRNGGVWYGFSSLLICSSCQAPSVRYNNSSHWRVNVARHFALALVGACKDCLWQLLASLPSHTWYKVVVSFTFFLGYALIAFIIRHSRLCYFFYLGLEKLPISFVSRPMIRSYIRLVHINISLLYIVVNPRYFWDAKLYS